MAKAYAAIHQKAILVYDLKDVGEKTKNNNVYHCTWHNAFAWFMHHTSLEWGITNDIFKFSLHFEQHVVIAVFSHKTIY